MKHFILSIILIFGLSTQLLHASQASPAHSRQDIHKTETTLLPKAKEKKTFKPFQKIKKGILKARKSVVFSRLSAVCSGLSLLSSLTITELAPLLFFGGGFLFLAIVFLGFAFYFFLKEKKEGLYSP